MKKNGIRIKICGLTNYEDAVRTLEAGADFIGFVLYPKSSRYISAADLVALAEKLPSACRKVGVFVNVPKSEVEQVAGDAGLHAVQLHGDETPDQFAGMKMPVWRAVRFRDGVCEPAFETWAVERYVVDACVPGRYGGSGVTADWPRAAELARRKKILLSGGLTVQNVEKAIRAVMPWGVDVAGGVEKKPGRKDIRKVEAFIRKVRRMVL